MLFKNCVNCMRLVSFILHVATGVKCCASHSISANLAQLRQIELSLDHTVDACDDFYGHACNNWAEHQADTNYDEITGLIDYKVNQQLINILESSYKRFSLPATDDECRSFVRKSRDYYQSCISEMTRNASRYLESIKPRDTLEWPLVEELHAYLHNEQTFELEMWPLEKWDLFAMLGRLQAYGFNNVLISQEIARTQNGSLQIMLEMPFDNESDAIPPHVLMVLLKGLGLPEQIAIKYAKKSIKTQQRWHDIYQNYSQTAGNAENRIKLTYTELGQQYPQLLRFLEKLLPQQIKADDFVVIANLDYFRYLLNKPWLPKEPQKLTNYVMMKFLVFLMQDTTNDFTPLDCIKDLRNKMDLAVNYLYYEHIYGITGAKVNYNIDILSRNIQKYFLSTLEQNNLNLSEEQLMQLEGKLKSLVINLGNFPKPLSLCKIEEFYKDVPALEPQNYYANHLQLLKHRFHKSLLNPQSQGFFVASDNRVGSSSAPIYIPKQHMAILPLGFLQLPIYHYSYDPLFIWSLLGFLLAHEFTHTIDTMGLLYGNDGHMLPVDPTIFENANFTAALDCMQAQEPTDAIDERLADLVGARVAYQAYVTQYQWNLQPYFSNIPWKKLFFYNMAQFFCGRQNVQFVDHDTDAVRLRQIAKNLDAFVEAFQCPTGSPMNPQQKCRLY